MAKVRKVDPSVLESDRDLPRPFYRAAVSSRCIGLAALALSVFTFVFARRLPRETSQPMVAAVILVGVILVLTGVAYLALAGWVSRRRKWAIKATFGLAFVDMTLLGMIVVSFFGSSRNSILVCIICFLFVVALGALTTFLGRSLEILKRLERPG